MVVIEYNYKIKWEKFDFKINEICGTWKCQNDYSTPTRTMTINPNGTIYDSILGIKMHFYIEGNKIICLYEGIEFVVYKISQMGNRSAIIEYDLLGSIYEYRWNKICDSFYL